MKKSILIVFFITLVMGLLSAQAVKIMPLGDSITGSPGCWRAILWNRLIDNGYTNIDFVGTLPPQGCALSHDGDNEGHGGYLVLDVASQNQLVGWLDATNPDVVMMHFGTNDTWCAKGTQNILNAYTTLVSQMRQNNPDMKILVAQITPLEPWNYNCSGCPSAVTDLNAAIPAWAAGLSTAQSPIVVVDQWTGYDTDTDTYDGVHPNDLGNQKISDKWYPALAAILSGDLPTPTPAYISGDVNNSGIVDIVDALMVAQYSVGLSVEGFLEAPADMDNNGVISIVDALMIAQCYVGIINC